MSVHEERFNCVLNDTARVQLAPGARLSLPNLFVVVVERVEAGTPGFGNLTVRGVTDRGRQVVVDIRHAGWPYADPGSAPAWYQQRHAVTGTVAA